MFDSDLFLEWTDSTRANRNIKSKVTDIATMIVFFISFFTPLMESYPGINAYTLIFIYCGDNQGTIREQSENRPLIDEFLYIYYGKVNAFLSPKEDAEAEADESDS